jgi:hypothetical protein
MATATAGFLQNLSDLHGIVEKSATIHEEYLSTYQKTRESLFDILRTSPLKIYPEFPYSRWMEMYFSFENIFFGGTPQNAKLGSELETAVKHVIKSRFPTLVPSDFVESKKQYPFQGGRMEIAIENKGRKTFVQVKRGFDTATWKRIIQEKEAVEQAGNRYLLLSPTEYTNEDIRKEIRENCLWKWCFIWKENCWKGEPYRDWMEKFLGAIDSGASL